MADVTVTKIARLCSRPNSHESLIFLYFWESYFLSYGEFGDIKIKLRVQDYCYG